MKNKISLFLLVFLQFFSSRSLFAQKEGNIWYFGDMAGLDFNSGSPVPLTNSAMSQVEGCASISDANGNLLFYTDGVTVWNSQHIVMQNGTGLLGYWSASQSVIIVPAPGNPMLKYIFTTDAVDNGGINGVNYSIVDMSLNGGLGAVTIKNVLLFAPSTEKLAAVRHGNGSDFWVVGHDYIGDGIHAYQVTSAGVNSIPVTSNVGASLTGITESVGQLRFSSDGQHLAMTMYSSLISEVFDFDNSTGIVSNPIDLNAPDKYGVEFSPGGQYLYLAQYQGVGAGVYQFDLLAGSAAAINASATLVGNSNTGDVCTMQLGPDHKIYVALVNWPSNNPYLARIEDPDLAGVACNFHDTAVYLNGKGSFYGLPNIFSGFSDLVFPLALFSAPNHICPGTCTAFVNNSISGTSFLWSFPGANPSTSTDVDPSNICYNSPGQYDVQLIATNANGSDTLLLHNYMTVYPYPAPQGILQNGDTLFANQGAVSYQWYHDGVLVPGATDYFYVASEGGNYNVVATDANGCEVEAVIFDVVAGVTPVHSSPQSSVVFPNPVQDKFAIDQVILRNYFSGETNFQVSIYNVIGEKISASYEVASFTVDCSALTQGVYFLEISAGGKIVRSKFIKSSGR